MKSDNILLDFDFEGFFQFLEAFGRLFFQTCASKNHPEFCGSELLKPANCRSEFFEARFADQKFLDPTLESLGLWKF